MSARTAALAGQRAAAAAMLDTCTVRRVTGRTFNETTGQYTPVEAVIYTGPCKVQERITGSGEEQAGGREVVHLAMELHLPMSVTDVEVDDVAEITASLDPAAVGRKLRVTQPMVRSYATARRLRVEEMTA